MKKAKIVLGLIGFGESWYVLLGKNGEFLGTAHKDNKSAVTELQEKLKTLNRSKYENQKS